MIINILDIMQTLASKGWFGSIAYYEFYANGGLKCLLDAFNWVTNKVHSIKPDAILAANWYHFEIIAKRISQFILHQVIEDEKNSRDSRLAEVFLQTLF
jgi:DNA modification methylase